MPTHDRKGRLQWSRKELIVLYTRRKQEYEQHNQESHPEYHKITQWLTEHEYEQ